MDYMGIFSDRLKELRIEKGLSQHQLAKQVGLTHTAIGLWERKQRIPNADAIVSLALFFNVTTDYLLGLEN